MLLVVAALATSVVPANASPAPLSPASVVTLVTGDRVDVQHGRVAVHAAPGRKHIRFLHRTDERGDRVVVPMDAAEAVRTGRLDRRLFNVTRLIAMGFGDRARPDLPLIVEQAAARALPKAERELPSIGGVAVRSSKATAARTWSGLAHARVWLDAPVRAALDRSTVQVGAPAAWRAGHTGKGVTIAVLDTGVDATHPALPRVVAAKDFTGSGTDDRQGHGTHVASIAARVAPDAVLLNGKVLDDGGGGSESAIIAGMEWAVGQGAKVVNMSLGGPATDGKDPMSLAVNRLTERTGALFVAATGNLGQAEAVMSPAVADTALAVGAVDSNDALAGFSNRGPRAGDDGLKPDITAPGVGIVAAKARNSTPEEPVGDRHARMSGTSMAAPHVAGAAAILAAQHPDWRADRLKAALMGTARPNPALGVHDQGAGRLDIARASAQTVHAMPASIHNGIAKWPHGDDEPVKTTVTYHNSGAAPVVLDLTPDVRAPSGMFTVHPGQITVPARGSASAVLTTDTRVAASDGRYGGALTATGGDVSVRTPIGVTREAESYDLKLSILDRQGKPAANASLQLDSLDRVAMYQSEPGVVRLPKGRYFLQASTWGDESTFFAEPTLLLDKDTELVLDARDGKPVGSTVDKPTAREFQAQVEVRRVTPSHMVVGGVSGESLARTFVRPSRTTASPGEFTFAAEQRLAEPDGKGGFAGSPYLYNVRIVRDGVVPSDLTRRVTDSSLVAVQGSHAATGSGQVGVREGVIKTPLPFTLNEFYTPGIPWTSSFEAGTTKISAVPRVFTKPTVERWNTAVLGPAFPKDQPGQHAGREGDVIEMRIPLFSGQNEHQFGFIEDTPGTTKLFRDDVLLASSPHPGWAEFSVPASPSAYRLEVSSPRVSAQWTFRSGHGSCDLPLLGVRFAPDVDVHNVARAGAVSISVSVHRNGGGSVVAVPSVEVSFDDGGRWEPARVVDGAVSVVNPAGGFVSLRARVGDGEGNTVVQTVIRAYAVGG
ncbi:S8 family serine peptidase [Allokutzneria sp. A3M-2-11 16]|uniref:S8 family peptidase n=1 Tax=Allokutzneria sp. A3M-2-11 16 TaxID=2962043 RepID=UPI0020B8B32F|nr:S8 family serine peptidase [Allokutzneria sp. A3M-2-11 16]MCP3805219.1 S8 family serine peptidase [Allokutzneria sp. A3M-2-11 16]